MGGQNETGAARAFPEDVGPAILWRLGRLRDDPELGPGRVNERDAVPCGGAAGPTAPQEIDGVIGVDAAARVQRPVAIPQAGIGTGTQDGARVGRRCGLAGPAPRGRGVSGDFPKGQQGDEAVLKGVKTAFDPAFGWGVGRHPVRDAQRGKRALELGAGIAASAGGRMAEPGQASGVEGDRQAVAPEDALAMLAVVPGGVGGHQDGGQEFARVVIQRQQEGLFLVGGPPRVEGGVVLPRARVRGERTLTQPVVDGLARASKVGRLSG